MGGWLVGQPSGKGKGDGKESGSKKWLHDDELVDFRDANRHAAREQWAMGRQPAKQRAGLSYSGGGARKVGRVTSFASTSQAELSLSQSSQEFHVTDTASSHLLAQLLLESRNATCISLLHPSSQRACFCDIPLPWLPCPAQAF